MPFYCPRCHQSSQNSSCSRCNAAGVSVSPVSPSPYQTQPFVFTPPAPSNAFVANQSSRPADRVVSPYFPMRPVRSLLNGDGSKVNDERLPLTTVQFCKASRCENRSPHGSPCAQCQRGNYFVKMQCPSCPEKFYGRNLTAKRQCDDCIAAYTILPG